MPDGLMEISQYREPVIKMLEQLRGWIKNNGITQRFKTVESCYTILSKPRSQSNRAETRNSRLPLKQRKGKCNTLDSPFLFSPISLLASPQVKCRQKPVGKETWEKTVYRRQPSWDLEKSRGSRCGISDQISKWATEHTSKELEFCHEEGTSLHGREPNVSISTEVQISCP